MNNNDAIINRVAQSPLVTLNLEEYFPNGERVLIDVKDQLFQGLLLREKDFRAYITNTDWAQYQGKHVAIHCSADAIVPVWAYMLLATQLAPFAQTVIFGDLRALEDHLFAQAIAALDLTAFEGKPVVVKGCGHLPIPESAYVAIAHRLQSIAKSIMYGEPCSTVPIYKKK